MQENEKIKFRHLNNFYNVDVIQGNNVGRTFPKHSHSSICLGVINRGTRVYTIGKREIYVDMGKSFVLNKGEVHSFTSLATHDYMCLCFDIRCFEYISEKIRHRISTKLYFDNNIMEDSHLYMLINRLC